MSARIDHIAGQTYHGRKGKIANAFRYSVDYVLLDAEAEVKTPALFARNRCGLTSLQDCDHGGDPGQGSGAAWVRDVLSRYQISNIEQIELLAQPRMWGHVFNPVSFWLCRDGSGALRAVIAEVTNTYGHRHSYLCVKPDGGAIAPKDRVEAKKLLHVSPFQPIAGSYSFRFDITDARIGIWIELDHGEGGIIATLTGLRKPMTNLSILRALLRRPLGSRRVLGLIHWQALKLWWKGSKFRSPPKPPAQDISR